MTPLRTYLQQVDRKTLVRVSALSSVLSTIEWTSSLVAIPPSILLARRTCLRKLLSSLKR